MSGVIPNVTSGLRKGKGRFPEVNLALGRGDVAEKKQKRQQRRGQLPDGCCTHRSPSHTGRAAGVLVAARTNVGVRPLLGEDGTWQSRSVWPIHLQAVPEPIASHGECLTDPTRLMPGPASPDLDLRLNASIVCCWRP